MNKIDYAFKPIGYIHSILTSREDAPRQGDEGAPEAWLELTFQFAQGLLSIAVNKDPP